MYDLFSIKLMYDFLYIPESVEINEKYTGSTLYMTIISKYYKKTSRCSNQNNKISLILLDVHVFLYLKSVYEPPLPLLDSIILLQN